MKSPDAISGIAPMNMACVARALCLSRTLVTASDLTVLGRSTRARRLAMHCRAWNDDFCQRGAAAGLRITAERLRRHESVGADGRRSPHAGRLSRTASRGTGTRQAGEQTVTRISSVVAGVFFCGLLGAWGSSPTASFYTLTVDMTLTPMTSTMPVHVVVNPVTIPDVVDRPLIVTRMGNNQVVLDEFARWGEPLKGDIARTIAGDLATLLASDRALGAVSRDIAGVIHAGAP